MIEIWPLQDNKYSSKTATNKTQTKTTANNIVYDKKLETHSIDDIALRVKFIDLSSNLYTVKSWTDYFNQLKDNSFFI
jgi:hypothetical protein